MKILVRTLETDLATKARGYKQLKRIGFKLIKREEKMDPKNGSKVPMGYIYRHFKREEKMDPKNGSKVPIGYIYIGISKKKFRAVIYIKTTQKGASSS